MYAHKDQDNTSAVTLRLITSHSRPAARARDSERSGETAAARPLMLRGLRGLRGLAGRPRVTGLVLAAAGWAATFAVVILGTHPGRVAAVQIIFAATMITVAMSQTLLSPALTVIIDYRVPRGARLYKKLGTSAFVAGCLLGPAASGAALGTGWGTSLLTTLAVACALASIAARRLGHAGGRSRLRRASYRQEIQEI